MVPLRATTIRAWTAVLLFAMVAAVASGEAAAVSPRQLVEIVDIAGPTTSPDGRLVAYRTEQASTQRNSYDTRWYVAAVDGSSPPRLLADGGVPLRNSSGVTLAPEVQWSPDARWIYFRARVDGRVSVWGAAIDGSEVREMTRSPADVRTFRLSGEGRALQFEVGPDRDEIRKEEEREYDHGIRIDASVPVGQGLFRSGLLDEVPATQRLQDNEVIRHPLLAEVPGRWFAVDLTTGEQRGLAAGELADARNRDAKGATGAWKRVRDASSGRVAELTRVGVRGGLRDSPDVELAVSTRGGRERIVCTAVECRGVAITGIAWRPGGREVVYTISDPEAAYAQRLMAWNPESGAVRPIVEADGLLAGGRDRFSGCGLTSVALVCVASDATLPPRLERIDLDSGLRTVLNDPNAALALDTGRVSIRTLQWTDADGVQFTGQLYLPVTADGRAVPLVISYYWCLGYVRGGLGDEIPFASLASAGIAALCINRAPVRNDAVDRYELGRSAVESAVELLATKGIVRRDRVGMGGLSFGTEVTLWTAMYSDVLAAASVSSPMLSPQLRLLLSLQGDAFEQRLDDYWQLGGRDVSAAGWQKLSPVFNLDRFRLPILMQLPEQEYLHTLDYAIPLMRRKIADMYVFPNEPHQKFQPRHKLAVYERNLDWFRFWLLDEEDAAPEKRVQYARWREMRGPVAEANAHHAEAQD